MHPKNTLSAFLAILALFLAPILPSHGAEATASTGSVTGRVFNADTGAALANARVSVEGTSLQAITDASGTYRLTGVPAGTARLNVLYVGLAPQEATVDLAGGGSVQQTFELRRPGDDDSTLQLETMKVVENRQMDAQALAINDQRFAPNIKSVVALDEYGDRGHENIGEFLHFLPEVAVNVSGDSGPGSISLRGLPASNSGLLLDGGEIAGARSNSRSIDPHDVPMLNVSRVEVTKVPTPDMPASGLGGTVNLISRSGFEQKKRTLSYQVYTLFHSGNGLTFDGGDQKQTPAITPKYIHPSYEFTYLHPVTQDFAITAGVSSTWRMKFHDEDARDETMVWDLVNGIQRESTWTANAQLYTSFAKQLGFDWRLTPEDTLSFGYQEKDFTMTVHRSLFRVNYGAGVTGNENFSQGTSAGVGTATQGALNSYEHKAMNRQLTLRYRHIGSIWRMDGMAYHSLADYQRADIDDGYFHTVQTTISNLIIRGDEPTGGIGPRFTRFTATTRAGDPVDLYDGGGYAINNATTNQIDNDTVTTGARFGVSRDFGGTIPVTVKVGGAVDRSERDQRTYNKTWNFRPNGATDVASRLARNFDVFDEGFLATSPLVHGVKLRDISFMKTYQLYQQHPDWFVLDEPGAHQNLVTSSREFSETVSAAYVRLDSHLLNNRLWLVGGVRFERTEVEGRGPLDDINAQYQRNPDGSFVRNGAGQRVLITNDALALRKLRYVERGAEAENTYDGLYPSLSATYNLTDKLLVRAAYARTVGRPDVSFITPGVTIGEPDVAQPTITVNNPGLTPWTADNLDLSLESYNIKDGFGSVGIFQKNISDFFGSVQQAATPALLEEYGLPNDGSLSSYQIATLQNAGDAKITGLELNYRQNLKFLPEWASGFQVFVNATKLKLSGSATADFSGFNPSKYAGGISFIRPRYFVKFTYTYQGETRRAAVAANAANGIPVGTYNYQGARTRMGVNAEFNVNKYVSLYGSVMDLGGFELIGRQYAPNTPEYARGNNIQQLGYYITLGVKGKF